MTRRTSTHFYLVGAFVAILTFSACGGAAAVAGPPGPTATVQATTGEQFKPGQVDITAGGTVTWQFAGLAHNVTFATGVAGTPTDIALTSNANVSRTFATAGTFAYQCTIHPGMTGTVVVH